MLFFTLLFIFLTFVLWFERTTVNHRICVDLHVFLNTFLYYSIFKVHPAQCRSRSIIYTIKRLSTHLLKGRKNSDMAPENEKTAHFERLLGETLVFAHDLFKEVERNLYPGFF